MKKVNAALTELKRAIKVRVYNENKDAILSLIPNVGGRLLDLGCNDGYYTIRLAEKAGVKQEDVFGLGYNPNVKPIFHFNCLDLEQGNLPYQDGFFDIVIADQVFEHLKNVGLLMYEISRIMKVGGILIVSVPNLAAWHNRLLLMIGKQRLCIQRLDLHIRGFTFAALKRLLTNKGYRIVNQLRSGIYPFYGFLPQFICRFVPGFAVFQYALSIKQKELSRGMRSQYYHFHDTVVDL